MAAVRARILGGLAAAVLVLGLATPAHAASPAVRVTVAPGGPEYQAALDGNWADVTIDVFDAAAPDASEPVMTVTGPGSAGFSGGIDLDLDPGTYRVRASADGWRPAWYRAPVAAVSELPVLGLYGWHAEATFTTASDVVVTGAEEETSQIALMLFRSASSVAGFVSDVSRSYFPWEAFDDRDVFVELLPTAGGTAIGPLATDGVYSFDDVAPGTYTIRATVGRTASGAPAATPGDLVDPTVHWYPGTTSQAARGTFIVRPGGGHWVSADVTTDPTYQENAGGGVIEGDLYPGGVVAARLDFPLSSGGIVIEGYEWSIDDVPVPGATARIFTIPADAVGKTVSVRILTHLLFAAWRASADASATVSAATGSLFSAPVPTVTGTAVLGATLTAQPGTWTPAAAKTYQWRRDGAPIENATARQYQPVAADLGHALSVAVSSARPGSAPATRTSEPVAVVEQTFASVTTPSIRGQARFPTTLTAGAGVARPAAAATTWQWYRNGIAIVGATAQTLTPVDSDVNAALTVQVSVQRPGYELTTATSAPVVLQPGVITAPRPTINGTAKVGQTLSIDTTAWSPRPLDIAYQWQRQSAGSWTTVATTSTYPLTTADRGSRIRLVVTVSKPGYTTVERTTAATAAVAR